MMLRNENPMEKSVQTYSDSGHEFDSYLRVLSAFPGGVADADITTGADVQYLGGDLRVACERQLRFFGCCGEQEREFVEREQMHCQSDYRRNLSMMYASAISTSSTIRLVRICVGMMTATMVVVSFSFPVMADTIDSTDFNYLAWGENVGWLNWGSTEGGVFVPDSAADGGELTGYVWGENVGWISLNCSNESSCGTVDFHASRSQGNLFGYAWGENVGWISFSCETTSSCGTVDYGVAIATTSGDFSGYAWGENVGWINFNCSNDASCGTVDFKVKIEPDVAPPGGGAGCPGPGILGYASTCWCTANPSDSLCASPAPFTPMVTSMTPPGPVVTSAPVIGVPPATPPSGPAVSPPPAGPPAFSPTPPSVPGVPGVIDRVGRSIDNFLDRFFDNLVESGAGIVTAFAIAPLLWAAFEIFQTKSASAVAYSFLQVFGLKKRTKVWGTVYDSRTKHPIAFARVQILDEANRVLENRFADRDGRFGFLLRPPSENEPVRHVRLVAAKEGYEFPSKEVGPGTDFGVYEHVYLGTVIEVTSETALTYDIPLDPVAVQGKPAHMPFVGAITNTWETVLNIGFYAGLVLIPYNMILHPSIPNFIIGIVFFAANGYRIFKVYRPYGHVNDIASGQTVPFSLVTLHDESGKRLAFAVSDEIGRYFLTAHHRENVQVRVHTPANIVPPRSTTEDFSRHSKDIKRGWITKDMRV